VSVKEIVEQKTIDWIQNLENAGKDVLNFGKEQIPLFVEELLAYHLYENIVWATFYFVLVFFGICLCINSSIRILKYLPELASDDPSSLMYTIIHISLIMSGLLLIAVNTPPHIEYVNRSVKIKISPRLYLVEWVTDLTKVSSQFDNNHNFTGP